MEVLHLIGEETSFSAKTNGKIQH